MAELFKSKEQNEESRFLYVSHEFDKSKGTVALALWPEGLVLWVGGEIVWKEWTPKGR